MKSYNGFTPEQRMHGDKIIKRAIAEGKLPPLSETKCILCGQDKGIRHYHCEDYSEDKILDDVVPVCWRCHMMIHSRFRNRKAFDIYMEEVKGGKTYPPVFRHDFKILDEHFAKAEERNKDEDR